MSTTPSEIRELVRRQWTAALKKVLVSMTSGTFEITVDGGIEPNAPGEQTAAYSWYSQALSFSADAFVWVGAAEATWITLGKSLLSALGVDEGSHEDALSICKDIVAQSNSALAQELSKRLGPEITCGGILPGNQPTGHAPIAISITAAILPSPIAIGLCFDDALFTYLSSYTGSRQEKPSIPQIRPSISGIPLQLYATLGRTELLLDNVLNLSIGSVIDLGRTVHESVDLVANGKVIASGQVVAFKGNYAIKVMSTRSRNATDGSGAETINPAAARPDPPSSSGTGAYYD